LLSTFVSRQGCLFIPRSRSQPLRRRVAHHPERRPCSLLSRALCSVRLVNRRRPKPRKPTRSSCAAKRPRYALWTAAHRRRQRRGPVRRPSPSPSGQDHTEGQRMASTAVTGGDGDLCPSHRDSSNRTPNQELAAIKR
jgi:hypothetical protein